MPAGRVHVLPFVFIATSLQKTYLPSAYRVAVTPGYGGGDLFVRSSGGLFGLTSGAPTDTGFRTFVDPLAVPEPTSLALLATGLVALGIIRRRKRASA